jgi:hypothetical protein
MEGEFREYLKQTAIDSGTAVASFAGGLRSRRPEVFMSTRALVAVALFCTAVVCEGADLSTYVGGSIGRGVAIEVVDDVDPDSNDPSFKLFGGIGVGENFAVEISYHDFGTTKCCGPSYADLGFERSGKAFSGSALALWPISRLRLFAKAGVLRWNVDGYDLTIAGLQPYANDGVDFLAGVGGDIAVVSGLRIRLEWERLEIDDDAADLVTIGVLWRF